MLKSHARLVRPAAGLAAAWLLAVAAVGASRQAGPAESPYELTTPTGALAGTLVTPPSGARWPAVLIVAGSGPTDRDGNSAGLPGKNNAYRQLAEALAANGIASVRYDKRGIGASASSAPKEVDLRFEHYVADAAAWITRMRNDARFTSVTVVGHSEGSLIGIVAARAARADGLVSIAGVGRRASDVLRDQLRQQIQTTSDLWTASESVLASLDAGQTTAAFPPALASLYRPSVQPYLISWFRYSPAAEFAKWIAPALIIQGTTDVQVGVPEADLLKAAKPDAELRVVDGMNHVLKAVSGARLAQLPSYSDPTLPIVADVPRAIGAFVRGLRHPQHPAVERRSLRDVVFAAIDGCRMAIEYGRPSKRGRVIWGTLVPFGRWWMPGADESTVLTTSEPIVLGSLSVPAGDYTIYSVPGDPTFTLAINKEVGQFHTVYHPDRDLGRVEMARTATAEPVERLTFAIGRGATGGGVLKMSWDDREYSVAFAVKK